MNLEMASYIEINAVGIVMLLILCYYAGTARYGVDVCSQHHFMRMAIRWPSATAAGYTGRRTAPSLSMR